MSYREIRHKTVKPKAARYCEWCREICPAKHECVYRLYATDEGIQRGWMHLECFVAMEKSSPDIKDGWIPGMPKRGMAI